MEKKRNILEGKLQPPVGSSDWAELSQKSYCVDKTLLIKELVDRDTKVALFTRPRRFGKTTAMKMLKAFFEKTGEDTSHLFADKKIWAAGEKYREKQGKYPVIYFTFKDIKCETWSDAERTLIATVGREVARHKSAVCSDWADEATRDTLMRVMNQKASILEVSWALGYLAEAIHVCHGVKPVILIDEYDMPISVASTNGFYEKMVAFMRTFLSGAMKDNDHCEMGVMTGVLRVAKEGILSGLNNPSVWTIFESPFSEYFGFTEDEVRTMAEYYGVPEKMSEIKRWYDGYVFGGTEIYNPWSVLSYFFNECVPKAYWLGTSSNNLITEIIRRYPHDLTKTCEMLMRGKAARVRMAEELGPYSEIVDRPETLYALLVASGYLKVVSKIDGNGMCSVRFPNREIAGIFISEIQSKTHLAAKDGAQSIVNAFDARDPVAMQKAIAEFLRESVSYFDTASEGFFHGLTLGFLAIMRDRYRVESNAESGDGRFDIALTPRSSRYPGFAIEVKAADNDSDDLKALAQSALDQIVAKDYVAKTECAMKALKSTQPVVKIGLAYYKKRVQLVQS